MISRIFSQARRPAGFECSRPPWLHIPADSEFTFLRDSSYRNAERKGITRRSSTWPAGYITPYSHVNGVDEILRTSDTFYSARCFPLYNPCTRRRIAAALCFLPYLMEWACWGYFSQENFPVISVKIRMDPTETQWAIGPMLWTSYLTNRTLVLL